MDIHFATDSKATWPAAILLLLAPADISWWRFRVFSMPREFVVSDHRKACRTAPARHASGQGGQQTPGSKMHSRYTNPCGYIRMCVYIHIYICVSTHMHTSLLEGECVCVSVCARNVILLFINGIATWDRVKVGAFGCMRHNAHGSRT